ncbi:MAG: DUF4838 domain-containing protein [Chloroflexi bacterium]|nr:DUF4838 domain-containing protein [Chloroflexota bacterium]
MWTVFSPRGSFSSASEAAVGEETVDWSKAADVNHDACTLSFAAVEVVDSLGRVTGEESQLKAWPERSSDLPQTNGVLILSPGHYEACRNLIKDLFDVKEPPKTEQSFLLKSTDVEGRKWYLVLGSDRAGALYGAYELLNTLGFRWFSPDPWGRDIPDSLPVPLPDLDLTQSPSFLSRGFQARHDRGGEDFLLWMARNKLNFWTGAESNKPLCHKLCLKLAGGGHMIFDRYVPPSRYFGQHPEWYALRDGKRSGNIHGSVGDNVCLSNPEVRHKIASDLTEDLISGDWRWLDLVDVWPLDNGKWCECERCKELGNPTDQILLLAHDCSRVIREARREGRLNRDVLIVCPAYHETLPVPSKPLPEDFDHDRVAVVFFPIERCYVHSFADPACTEINATLRELWESWTKATGKRFHGAMIVGEYYNVSSFSAMAIPLMKVMANDIPYYHSTGTRHMHYMHVVTADCGTLSLTNSLFAALLWNHRTDCDSFVLDYMDMRYRAQAPLMMDFYSLLEKAMANAKPMKHYMGMAGVNRYALFNNLRRKGSPESPSLLFAMKHFPYNPAYRTENNGPSFVEIVEMMGRAAALLDRSLLECEDDVVAPRLTADARRFRYTHNMVRFLHHFARLRLFENRGRSECAELEARALRDYGEALRREKLMVLHQWQDDEYHFYDSGLTATWLPQAYAEVMADYGLEVLETNGKPVEKDKRLG